MKMQNLLLLIVCFIFTGKNDSSAQQTIRVIPKVIDDILINPGIGFNTFQMFNGDNLDVWIDVLNEIDLSIYGKNESFKNENHPPSSTAYFRIQWRAIEPEQGIYRWDLIDGLLNIAHERNQTLMLRISPYSWKEDDDVPEWYRKKVGPKRDFKSGERVLKWVVDPEDPRYAQYFGGMIRALGERFDGHPDLESIDVSVVGYAGENNGMSVLTEKTMKALLDPYIESFRKTHLVVLIHGKKANDYITSKTTVGWRQDCLGDLGFWDQTPAWNHMYDYYPQTIIDYNMQDAWKNAPVTFEICGIFDTWAMTEGFNTWDLKEPYSEKEVQYIIDQSLKWHMSSFNAKSSPVPDEWEPMVDEWLKKMGYRFILRNFKYPDKVQVNGKLNFESWWENTGVAPCYNRNYKLALRLKNVESDIILLTDADITRWLPGDAIFNNGIFIPHEFSPGKYKLQLSIVDQQLRVPRIKLAIEGIDNEGWYTLGNIEIVK